MMITEKLSKTQQKVMNAWPDTCEVCYFPKPEGDGNHREFVRCRDIKGKKRYAGMVYIGGSTVEALARKGAIKKVNSDPWFHVYHRA